MPLIQNKNLAGQSVITGSGVIEFDKKGIAKLDNEKLFRSLSTVPNFFPVKQEEPVQKTAGRKS